MAILLYLNFSYNIGYCTERLISYVEAASRNRSSHQHIGKHRSRVPLCLETAVQHITRPPAKHCLSTERKNSTSTEHPKPSLSHGACIDFLAFQPRIGRGQGRASPIQALGRGANTRSGTSGMPVSRPHQCLSRELMSMACQLKHGEAYG